MTFAAVARRAAVGRGTIQVAFGSEEALHRALGTWLMAALIGEDAQAA
ncbi:MAG: hypothetical protein QOD86_2863 [Miltoncostaeaceae bacterium]|nr:hypothetical protein [Miltoncostaeaceae bacterium]